MQLPAMASIPAGSFLMGGGDYERCPDGLPRHTVHLDDFQISREPISHALYLAFCENTQRTTDVRDDRGYVIGVSWYDARDFCRWLSDATGMALRLPTEAEWEYCARHASTFGVDRLCDLSLREWCGDWYDVYPQGEQSNPAGADEGLFKVVRGGFLDNPLRYNEYPLDLWRRASLPPDYRHIPGDENDFGRHNIGFRVVCAKPGITREPIHSPSISRMVRTQRKDEDFTAVETPYFRKRYVLPVPPDNASNEEIRAMGLNPVMRHHHHSPGFTVALNGDLLVSFYSTYHEYDAESGLIAARLPYGAEEWEMPDIFLNPAGVNDHAPLFFTDEDGTIYHFWGWQQLEHAFPFQYTCSKDHGQTWEPVRFPHFTGKAHRVIRQPVNSLFRSREGIYYLACDAMEGSATVLWRSRDLIHWEDPKGRTAGRHSTAVELSDGSLLAMGGKNSDIDGYMPKAISRDRGDTWQVEKTPFPALTSGQRPCIIRLASGRLFMCGDYQNKQGERPYPADDPRWGSYAAYSEDEGKTWTLKTLWGAQQRKKDPDLFGGASTLGYSVCKQGRDGLIHVISSNVHPCLHLCFNEAWLLSPEQSEPTDIMKSRATRMLSCREYQEHYEDGQLRCCYQAGTADDGRFLLHGTEKWYYPDGSIMAVGEYALGRRVGEMTYYRKSGARLYRWNILEDRSLYSTYDENDTLRSVGGYMNRMAQGIAQTFDREGALQSEVRFESGVMVESRDLRREAPTPMAEILEGQA